MMRVKTATYGVVGLCFADMEFKISSEVVGGKEVRE
jgi:hypothetical protein